MSPRLSPTDEWESASEEEDWDDDSDGWIDVYHSSDEEQEEKKETPQEVEDRRKLAQEVSTTRIMTQEDFRRLQTAQLAKEAGLKELPKSRKRKRPAQSSQERWKERALDSIEVSELTLDVLMLLICWQCFRAKKNSSIEKDQWSLFFFCTQLI